VFDSRSEKWGISEGMPDAPARVSFPRAVWAMLAVVGLLQVGGILTQLVVVEDQREIVRDQLDIAERQRRDSKPLVDQAKPLVDEAKPLVHAALEDLPQTRRLGRQLRRLVRETTPLVEDLNRTPVASGIRAGTQLTIDLLRADLPGAVRSASALMGELRDVQLVSRSVRAADAVPRMLHVQRRTLRIQLRTLRIQTRALARIETLLGVARETERHAESIDRKTGGELPAP
jgi:hypothetical protein